jgi:hypothetical protein
MWADNETTIDLLSIEHLPATVESVVLNPRLLPVTVGVFGGGGSGKSSIIRMTHSRLREREDVLCVSFNGWLFENYEDAKSALMGTILDEVRTKRTLSKKAEELVGRLLARVDWFRTMGLVGKGALTLATGLPLVGLSDLKGVFKGELPSEADLASLKEKTDSIDVGALAKLVRDAPGEDIRKTVREFHDDFAELIEETRLRALVVFIDDLDRCLPDTVIGTLEAIRLFLSAPKTAFVIGADEDLIHHAVERRFPEARGIRPDVGRDYLEKLVQIPIRVPPLGRNEIETYMALLFADLHLDDGFPTLLDALKGRAEGSGQSGYVERFDRSVADEVLAPCPPDLAEDLLLVQQTVDVLTSGLDGNPRQTKRFLNTLLLRTTMAASREIVLGRRNLAKLMLLEYFKTEAFRTLAGLQGAQEGRPAELAASEARARGAVQPASAAEPEDADQKEGSAGAETNGVDDEGAADGDMGPLEKWSDDPWLAAWLSSDPPLAEVDLRPYFYFSRDRVGLYSGPAARMSPAARSVLEGLSSISAVERIAAAKQSAALSPVDGAAVFQALTERARRAEDLSQEHSPLYGLLSLVENREGLATDMVQFLGDVPHALIPFAVLPRIAMALGTGVSAGAARDLLGRWAESDTSRQLAAAAKTVMSSLD